MYFEAWRLGLKGITIFRAGSKNRQVLTLEGGRGRGQPGAVRPVRPGRLPILPEQIPLSGRLRLGNSDEAPAVFLALEKPFVRADAFDHVVMVVTVSNACRGGT